MDCSVIFEARGCARVRGRAFRTSRSLGKIIIAASALRAAERLRACSPQNVTDSKTMDTGPQTVNDRQPQTHNKQ